MMLKSVHSLVSLGELLHKAVRERGGEEGRRGSVYSTHVLMATHDRGER